VLQRWDGFAHLLDDGRVCLTTMPPSGRSAASRSAVRPGASLDQTAVPRVRLSCTASSAPSGSTTSIRKHGLLMSSPRIAEIPKNRLGERPPWNWRYCAENLKAA
jgi:hypothetical protein